MPWVQLQLKHIKWRSPFTAERIKWVHFHGLGHSYPKCLPAAAAHNYQPTSGESPARRARTALSKAPLFCSGLQNRKVDGYEHNLAEWFYFTVRGTPGSLLPAKFQKCLYSEWGLGSGRASYTIFAKRQMGKSQPEDTLYARHTHFVSDGLKVRSKASKLHISFLITFQLGTLEHIHRDSFF